MGHHYLNKLSWFVFACMLLSGITWAQERHFTVSDGKINQISEMMEQYEQQDLFSGVVLLAKDGKPIFSHAYGFADRETKIPNRIDTLFNIASVGKLYTAVLTLSLVDQGKISLDDKMAKYLDGFPREVAEQVTIRHLISMTAGLGNYFENPKFQTDPKQYESVGDLVRIIKEEELLYVPGTRERYSNSSFVLLGAVIEKVTGMAYADSVTEFIFKPIGMHESFFSPTEQTNRALGYHKTPDGVYYPVDYFPASPAGGSYSSAGDLLAFCSMVSAENRLISDNSKISFYSGYDPAYQGNWDTLRRELRYVFGWTGTAEGASAVLRHYIESSNNISIILLSNYTGASEEIYANLVSILKKE